MRRNRRIEEDIQKLGEDLRVARLKRSLPQSVVAERAGIALTTMRQIESGKVSCSIGNYAAVLFALGFGNPFGSLASFEHDPIGEALVNQELPQRARMKKEVNKNA